VFNIYKHKRRLRRLEAIEGLHSLPSKEAGGTALFYKGKEFAHIHNDNEIALRLTELKYSFTQPKMSMRLQILCVKQYQNYEGLGFSALGPSRDEDVPLRTNELWASRFNS
jgi:Family of unknown function (DUF5519)